MHMHSPTPSSRTCPLASYHPDAFVPCISVHIGAIVRVSGGPILPLTPTPTPYPYPYPLPPSRPCPDLYQVLAKQGKEWAKPEAGELGAGRSRPMERSGEAKERRGGEGRKPAAVDRTAEPEE